MATNVEVAGYCLDELLGLGSFGAVYKASRRSPSKIAPDTAPAVLAVKVVPLAKLDSTTRKALENEIALQQQLFHHPYIAKLYFATRSSRYIFLFFELLAGGDLQGHLKESLEGEHGRPLQPAVVQKAIKHLASAMHELWKRSILHRDIKPSNLIASESDLASPTCRIVLSDFGFARELSSSGGHHGSNSMAMAETLCGSPLYMPAEILKGQRYTARADLWSVGVLMVELLTSRTPFTGRTPQELLRNIEASAWAGLDPNKASAHASSAPALNPDDPATWPDHLQGTCGGVLNFPRRVATEGLAALDYHCRDLLFRLLRRNPSHRITFIDFFRHPWVDLAEAKAAIAPSSKSTTSTNADNDAGLSGAASGAGVEIPGKEVADSSLSGFTSPSSPPLPAASTPLKRATSAPTSAPPFEPAEQPARSQSAEAATVPDDASTAGDIDMPPSKALMRGLALLAGTATPPAKAQPPRSPTASEASEIKQADSGVAAHLDQEGTPGIVANLKPAPRDEPAPPDLTTESRFLGELLGLPSAFGVESVDAVMSQLAKKRRKQQQGADSIVAAGLLPPDSHATAVGGEAAGGAQDKHNDDVDGWALVEVVDIDDALFDRNGRLLSSKLPGGAMKAASAAGGADGYDFTGAGSELLAEEHFEDEEGGEDGVLVSVVRRHSSAPTAAPPLLPQSILFEKGATSASASSSSRGTMANRELQAAVARAESQLAAGLRLLQGALTAASCFQAHVPLLLPRALLASSALQAPIPCFETSSSLIQATVTAALGQSPFTDGVIPTGGLEEQEEIEETREALASTFASPPGTGTRATQAHDSSSLPYKRCVELAEEALLSLRSADAVLTMQLGPTDTAVAGDLARDPGCARACELRNALRERLRLASALLERLREGKVAIE